MQVSDQRRPRRGPSLVVLMPEAPSPAHAVSGWSGEPNPGRRIALIDAALRPPEPQLLDTCAIQGLDWVDRVADQEGGSVHWDDERRGALADRYGAEHADELIDLGTLYRTFEVRGAYPWLVCTTAVQEARLLRGEKGERVRDMLHFLAGHQEDWTVNAYPGIAVGLLLPVGPTRVSPLVLRGLGVRSSEEVLAPAGPLCFLPDRGDRLVAAQALLANIPAVLTLDRRTFWTHREALAEFGLQVLRPRELLALYEPYWQGLDAEFARRTHDDQ
jgi:hypothetical protein